MQILPPTSSSPPGSQEKAGSPGTCEISSTPATLSRAVSLFAYRLYPDEPQIVSVDRNRPFVLFSNGIDRFSWRSSSSAAGFGNKR